MNQPISPIRRFLTAFANCLAPKPAVSIYAVGVIVWVAGMLLLGLKSGEGNLSYALLESTRSLWQTAFLWSIAAVALAALIYSVKSKKSLLTVVAYTVVYTSPYALFLLGIWTLDAFYFQHPATVETSSILGPIFVIFYVIGILYMRARAERDKDEAQMFFILPTFTVVILLVGITAVKLFTSNEYIYRDAFRMVIESVDRKGDPVKVQGTLTLNKSGNYSFSAISNEMMISPDDMPRTLKVVWAGDVNEPTEEGDYKFSVDLPKSKLAQRGPWNPNAEDFAGPGYSGPEVYFQINLKPASKDGHVLLKSIPIWLDEFIPH